MGLMGWTYDQTLDTPMQEIVRAINGRRKAINSILRSVLGMPPETNATPAQAPRSGIVAQLANLMKRNRPEGTRQWLTLPNSV